MPDLEHALEDCLTQIASGESTLEECLARYPEYAGELRRLLAAAAQVERSRRVRPSAKFKSENRARLLAHMLETPRPRPQMPDFSGGMRWMLVLTALAASLSIVGTVAAQASLPGNGLYGWKLASEKIWRALSPDPLSADLALTRRRADELKQVAGEVGAETIARQAYRQALTGLNQYTDTASQEIIAASLAQQQSELTQVGLTMPELNQLLVLIQSTAGPLPPPASATGSSELAPDLPTNESSVELIPGGSPSTSTLFVVTAIPGLSTAVPESLP